MCGHDTHVLSQHYSAIMTRMWSQASHAFHKRDALSRFITFGAKAKWRMWEVVKVKRANIDITKKHNHCPERFWRSDSNTFSHKGEPPRNEIPWYTKIFKAFSLFTGLFAVVYSLNPDSKFLGGKIRDHLKADDICLFSTDRFCFVVLFCFGPQEACLLDFLLKTIYIRTHKNNTQNCQHDKQVRIKQECNENTLQQVTTRHWVTNVLEGDRIFTIFFPHHPWWIGERE